MQIMTILKQRKDNDVDKAVKSILRWAPYTDKKELMEAADKIKTKLANPDWRDTIKSWKKPKVAEAAGGTSKFNEDDHKRNNDGEFAKQAGGSKESETSTPDRIPTDKIREMVNSLKEDVIKDGAVQGMEYEDTISNQIDTDEYLKRDINERYYLKPTHANEKPITMDDEINSSMPLIHVDDQEKFWDAYGEVESQAFLEGEVNNMDPSWAIKNGMEEHLKKTNTLYRGTSASNILEFLKTGIIGGTPDEDEINYSAADQKDFVSTTLSYEKAIDFSFNHDDDYLTVRFDTSNMPESDYHVMDYNLRPDLRVWDPSRENVESQDYRPSEKFGGEHSARFANELEVQLKRGTKPKIAEIIIPSDKQSGQDYQEIIRLAKQQGISLNIHEDYDSDGDPDA